MPSSFETIVKCLLNSYILLLTWLLPLALVGCLSMEVLLEEFLIVSQKIMQNEATPLWKLFRKSEQNEGKVDNSG